MRFEETGYVLAAVSSAGDGVWGKRIGEFSRLLKIPPGSIQKANKIVFCICAEKTSSSTSYLGTERWRSGCRKIIRLRPILAMVDEALKAMDGRLEEIYPEDGRKSIPPERLLRALLLQMLYSIRSERMLMEQMEYNLLYRWFVGLSMNEEVWHPTVFTKNRDRLLEGEIAEEFFRVVLRQARRKKLLSDEHFTVDGTLIEAWAGQKSFQLKDDDGILKPPPPPDPGSNPALDYRKQKRSNDTHRSKTDPLARLYKKAKGAEAKLAYLGHILTENCNGLVVNTRVTLATGTAERAAAIEMAEKIPGGVSA